MCSDMKMKMVLSGTKVISNSKDLESFMGCSFPGEIEIHPLNPSSTKGIKEERKWQQQKQQRHCSVCGQYAYHGARNYSVKEKKSSRDEDIL